MVNILDLSMVAKCVGTALSMVESCSIADSNDDGKVDGSDLNWLRSFFGSSGYPVTPAPAKIATGPDGERFVKDELLVVLSETVQNPVQRARQVAAASGGVVLGGVGSARTFQIRYNSSTLAELEVTAELVLRIAEVVVAIPHYMSLSVEAKAPLPSEFDYPNQSYLKVINAPAAWDLTTGSSSVAMGMFEKKVDRSYPDLVGTVKPQSPYLLGSPDAHATAVAAIMCADGTNGSGGVGVMWQCSLTPYSSSDDPLKNIERLMSAAENGVRVVNISLGYAYRNDECGISTPGQNWTARRLNSLYSHSLFNAGRGRDVLWVVAAGNSCRDTEFETPAGASVMSPDNVITVASVEGDLTKVLSSNYGAAVEIAAPGHIWITTRGGVGSGTSFAAPQVAGVAGLILSLNPLLTPKQVKRCILDYSTTRIVPHQFTLLNARAVNCVRPTCPPGTICGKVTDGETRSLLLSGETVTLSDRSNRLLATTVTNAHGRYSFADLEPGVYIPHLEYRWPGSSVTPDFMGSVGSPGGEERNFLVSNLPATVSVSAPANSVALALITASEWTSPHAPRSSSGVYFVYGVIPLEPLDLTVATAVPSLWLTCWMRDPPRPGGVFRKTSNWQLPRPPDTPGRKIKPFERLSVSCPTF